ncbi:MAG: hypothetical protein ACREGA_01925 [Candidatus Saccharimonadales bacterium]
MKIYSYTAAELNVGPATHVARLAVFSSLETGYDPVLHDLGQPYDNYRDENIDVNPDGLPTQLEALEADEQAFAEVHEGYTLGSLDQRAFAVLALMDRIRDVSPQSQILSRGFMRVPRLGRRSMDGYLLVGYVGSCDRQLNLNGSNGNANSNIGVGRSMRQKFIYWTLLRSSAGLAAYFC